LLKAIFALEINYNWVLSQLEVKSHRICVLVTEQKQCSRQICEQSTVAVTGTNSLNGEMTASRIKKYGILLFLDAFFKEFCELLV